MTATPLIYMDYHATTPVDPRVRDAMLPFFDENFGNAASRSHNFGRKAKAAVDDARQAVARMVGAKASEVIFTSGATEADNLAVKGVAQAKASRGKHIVTQRTEHKAVLDSCKRLEGEGFELSYLEVDSEGKVDPAAVASALREDTALVSVMLANNEVGTVQDVQAIGRLTRAHGALMHCDAAQGVGYLALSASDADLISLSAHKMYGPQGVGALIVGTACRQRGLIEPLVDGGGHEAGLRSGTLNVPGIVGFGCAAEIITDQGANEAAQIARLRDALQQRLLKLPEVRLNGSARARHPGNLNVSFGYVDGARLLLELCEVVAVSSGAACSSATPGPSYVLEAMGVEKAWAAASIRFGLGRHTTASEVDRVAEATAEIVKRLRGGSPAWERRQRGETVEW